MVADGVDVVVVGARCAGAPTAMLLARRGYRVVLLDRTTFPSDTVSTHLVHPQGVAALDRWGLLHRIIASGCPPIDTYAFDFGSATIEGSPGPFDSPVAYCPRRTVLDLVLVGGAADAGADVWEGFGVDRLLIDDGVVTGIAGSSPNGQHVELRARVVVGADGSRSLVARSVGAERYHERPRQLCGYYSYWSDLPMDGRFESYIREDRGFAAAPTNDGLSIVVGGWPYAQFDDHKSDLERKYLAMFDRAPEFAERLRKATRQTRVVGTTVPNFFRKPYGPGWALVGDAGCSKDFITAQGISDAFRDADLCASALDEAMSGRQTFDDALGDYQSTRDAQALPTFDFTMQLASLQPPDALRQLLESIHGHPGAMDAFAQLNAGNLSPSQFFAPGYVESLIGVR